MKAYMFSFDALLGFLVSLAIVYTLLIVILVPYGYYYEFEQAYVVARDTGLMMYNANWDSDTTYSQKLASLTHESNPHLSSFCGGFIANDKSIRNIVPSQYAYVIEYYNTTEGEWEEICNVNATYDTTVSCDSFRKFKVYAPLLIADYAGVGFNEGDLPYCYVSSKGYKGDDDYADPGMCFYTPCDATTDMATRPPVFTGVVRIGVCI